MKSNILSISFSKLNKDEAQYLADSVIKIVEKHNPETLNIKELFDILEEQKPQINILRQGYGSHPVTPKLVRLRERRNAYAQGIINDIRTIERARISELEEALQIAKPPVFRNLYQLSKLPEISIGQNLLEFFNLMIVDAKLSEALEELNLAKQFENLQVVNAAIEMHFDDRRVDVSARPKDKTPILVAALKKHILNLFKQIEVAQIKHKELDYSPLIDELNNEIAHMKAKLKARASYNKKKAEEKANNNTEGVEKPGEVVVMSSPEEPSKSTQSTQRMYPINAEVDNIEDNLEQLDIKKTVAVSTKQTRLPIVSPEA